MHTFKSHPLALFLLTLGLFFPLSLEAAGTRIIFESEKSVALGQEFLVKVLLDAGGTPINALSGTIHLGGEVDIKEIRDGGSIIPLWIDRPTIASTGRDISFAGIVPGSFSGKGELIQFVAISSLVSKAQQGNSASGNQKTIVPSNDSITISLSEVEALAPGPEPIAVTIQSAPATISISEDENATSTPTLLEDTIPPEPFTISIETDPNLFDGSPFAVFATQDKQSGVVGYEATFSFFAAPNESTWQSITSPYRIPPEGKGKRLYIRALDRKGNMTVTHMPLPGYYRNMTILAILTITILCLLYFVARRRGRSRHS